MGYDKVGCNESYEPPKKKKTERWDELLRKKRIVNGRITSESSYLEREVLAHSWPNECRKICSIGCKFFSRYK